MYNFILSSSICLSTFLLVSCKDESSKYKKDKHPLLKYNNQNSRKIAGKNSVFEVPKKRSKTFTENIEK